ncbi:MAG: long-chain fatty acid--CoA ligase [Bacteroidales bacterium]
MENVSRLFDLLINYKKKYQPKKDVVAGKIKGQWVYYNIDQLIENINSLSKALLDLGINKGDRVATVVHNSPEWNIIDFSIMQIGAIHVPIYPTSSKDDFEFILNDCKARVLFIAGNEVIDRIGNLSKNIPSIQKVFSIQPDNKQDDFYQILRNTTEETTLHKIHNLSKTIRTDDIASIIYTSGTTGNPKGVMLTHNNIVSNFKAVSYIPTFGENGKALSFLPLCHMYERMLNYLYFYLGISIYYAENLGTISQNIQEVKPDMMTAVPRFLEKVYEKIKHKSLDLQKFKKKIFDYSISIAEQYHPEKEKNISLYRLKLIISRKLVFNKWKKALGGNFKIIVSGGAALNEELAKIFWAAGIPIFEGYGLTETSPVIAVTDNNEKGITYGTVGPPIKGTQVKIADDGEIICSGPNVMVGYYNNKEKTQEVIDKDGWFHTGDIGEFNSKGHLKITGRKKEIFKTSLGKYIAPVPIENHLKTSPFIENVLVVGENQKFASAIIVPNFQYLKEWCKRNHIPYKKSEDILINKEVRYRVRSEIDDLNQKLGKTEQIHKYRFCKDIWSVESGDLTPTLKLKRNLVLKKYYNLIQEIYN